MRFSSTPVYAVAPLRYAPHKLYLVGRKEMNDIEKPELTPPTKTERFAEIIAVVTSAAPWIGGPVAEIIGGAATNLKIKRVTEFIQGVLEHVEALHTNAAEEFVKSEDFADILEKTSQAAADERHEAKRRLFSNYILNNISHPEITYDRRLKCLRTLTQVDIRHIDFLMALLQRPSMQELNLSMSAPSITIKRRVPHLSNDIGVIIHDTNTLGLTAIRNDYLNTNMTGSGAADLGHAVTEMGREFLSFLSKIE